MVFTDVLALSISDSLWGATLPYDVSRTYTVTVDMTLEDVTGKHPLRPYRFSFTPEPYFRVLEMSPEEGDQSVVARQTIQLRFNSRVDSGLFPALQIVPPVAGQWDQKFDSNIVVFFHQEPFAHGTWYTVRVTAEARDVYGNRVRGASDSRFRVLPFTILWTEPRQGYSLADVRSLIQFRATGPVDTASVRLAVRILPEVSGTYWAREEEFAFSPNVELIPDWLYTVTVSTDLRALDGTPLATPYQFWFRTDSFRVWYSTPSSGQTEVSRLQSISMRFTVTLDPQTVPSAFSISPSHSGRFRFDSEGRAFGWEPDTPLVPNTVYTVTISTALRSVGGVPLPAPYSFWFRTTL